MNKEQLISVWRAAAAGGSSTLPALFIHGPPHNSSPPPNLSPRFAFGRSFPRWMLVFSQHRRRFFDQKMCPASRWYFLNKHSLFFFFFLCSDTTLLERDQSGLSCHCFLVGLLIMKKFGNSLTFHSLLITEKHFEIPFIVLGL